MKKTLLLAIGLSVASMANVSQAADPALKTTDQKASYALGTDIAKNLHQQGVNLDIKALTLGLEDVLNQKPLRLTEEEMQTAVNEVKKAVMQKRMEERKAQAEKNAKAGEEFLAKNKTKPGVKTTSSGLQYKIITEGKGPSPTEDDMITAHYKGALIDGTVFDSSYDRGTPLEFKLGNVIKGWQEALKLMNAGAKWEVYIPAKLGYGEKGAGDRIGPNETLIFTVELIKFDKAK
ncbi:FKBP-type peptidyl-prolyl cis-trans isomerase [Thiomicrorhabdus sp. ZW0627]|uniref:FKBP-type peptidyl-prolyl cis-trans isomerase n=1 Tax=Thiomicrorhabdus sp. ZW0627 TaxID=3039774 RepID=UPI002437442C|nr:FKBP-type peptidyl-prolyl cis-trans isomerase [Thiomicrorhabdus sp. ZW0627]MDG6773311.1 FKBP-type peptidyl-prolyl cis-trans isomerase [Thiomicrorhabdus sp. ZW0627]